MKLRNLPVVEVAPDFYARLVTEARRRGCVPSSLVHGVLAELLKRLEADVVLHQPSRFCFCGGKGCRPAVVTDDPRVGDPMDAWREWFAKSVDAVEVERQLVDDGRMPPPCACAADVECSCGAAQ